MKKLVSFYQFEIKKSKFLAYAFNIESETEVEEILKNLKLEHKKSRHICFAYKLGNKIKYSDAGEPKGTAGLPIYNIIQKNNLNNISLFIVRYYGGIKLGSGGLYRSYTKAASECINLIDNQNF